MAEDVPNDPAEEADKERRRAEMADEEIRADEEWNGYAAAGHGGRLSTGLFTMVVIGLVVFGLLQFHYDRMRDDVPGGQVLERAVQLQAQDDFRAIFENGIWTAPNWPVRFYKRLREDSVFWGLLALAGAWVMVRGERARARRGVYLAWRAAQKEVDDLRRRISDLEKKAGKEGSDGGDL